ncbi:universal stress protein [Enterococcus faecalis]
MLQQYQRIMVAVDGSAEAELAFKKAVNVAKRNDATLLLAHVIDTRAFQSVSSFDGVLAEQATEMAKQTLESYKKDAQANGHDKVSTVIEYGSPKIIISKDLPKEHQIDLIIIGATGLNAVERLFIGSVSESVIRNAPCDVLVVRTDLDNKLPTTKKTTEAN